jgi:hypothetical protein
MTWTLTSVTSQWAIEQAVIRRPSPALMRRSYRWGRLRSKAAVRLSRATPTSPASGTFARVIRWRERSRRNRSRRRLTRAQKIGAERPPSTRHVVPEAMQVASSEEADQGDGADHRRRDAKPNARLRSRSNRSAAPSRPNGPIGQAPRPNRLPTKRSDQCLPRVGPRLSPPCRAHTIARAHVGDSVRLGCEHDAAPPAQLGQRWALPT